MHIVERILLGFCLAALLLPGVATAQVQSVEIVHRGIFTADLVSSSRDERGLNQNKSKDFRLAVNTTDIPAQIGVRFGFQFRIIGSPAGKTVTLRKVTVYPPAGVVPAKTGKRLSSDEATLTPQIGAVAYTGYRFDDPWELVPGAWTVQLWDGSRKLVEVKFNVKAK